MNQNNQQFPLGKICLLPLLLLLLWAVKNQPVAFMLIEQPNLILPYLVEQFGLMKLVAGGLTTVLIFSFVAINASSQNNRNVVRGAKIIPSRRLKAILRRQQRLKNQLQLELAGMPIPAKLENRGFFMFGSPGSGKTQAISQMTAILRQRNDFRAILFDRDGEMLEKFYDPSQDLIFNPFDARSVQWSHVHEAVRPETMAAALIPQESAKEPFFYNAGSSSNGRVVSPD